MGQFVYLTAFYSETGLPNINIILTYYGENITEPVLIGNLLIKPLAQGVSSLCGSRLVQGAGETRPYQ